MKKQIITALIALLAIPIVIYTVGRLELAGTNNVLHGTYIDIIRSGWLFVMKAGIVIGVFELLKGVKK